MVADMADMGGYGKRADMEKTPYPPEKSAEILKTDMKTIYSKPPFWSMADMADMKLKPTVFPKTDMADING